MPQNEYTDIIDGDWEAANRVVRRLYERLAKLEGYGGEMSKYSNTDMDANRLKGGPSGMVHAELDEFITKDYLRSPEAAYVIGEGIKTGGFGALTLASSLPGGNLVGGSQTLPPEIKIAGVDDTFYTDFTRASQIFAPIYTPESGSTLTLTTNGFSGTMTNSITGTNDGNFIVGVSSKFSIFPSEDTGEIEFVVHLSNLEYDTLTTYEDNIGVGVWVNGLEGQNLGPSGHGYAPCLSLDYSESTTQCFYGSFGYDTGLASQRPEFNFDSPVTQFAGTSGTIDGYIKVLIGWTVVTTSSNYNVMHMKNAQWSTDAATWNDYFWRSPGSTSTNIVSMGFNRAVNLTLGYFGKYGINCNFTIDSVEVTKGLVVF